MPNAIEKLFQQIKGFYSDASPTKKTSIALAFFIVISSFVVVGLMLGGRNYSNLFTNVPPGQMPVIIGKLSEKQIPYKIVDNGTTIAIPSQFLHSTQMMLMSETGFAEIGKIGFELFDKDSFGSTSYEQRIKYQRALQGELMRTINTLDGVRSSKVILAIPPKKTFLEEGDSPTASVVVDLNDNKSLNLDQVRGIIHLVSNAVEGLEPERVSVVDSRGKVLSKNIVGGLAALSNDMMSFKMAREQEFERRVEDILSRVVGQGKVIARVNAEVNFQQVSSVEEIVDPDKQAVRTITEEEEKLDGNRTNTAGVPGARSNLPGADNPNSVGFKQNVDKSLKTTVFDNGKTIRNVKEPVGSIEKVSIAVLVDGVVEITKNEAGDPVENWKPRSAEELAKYESIVKNAIGFNEQRGDTVKIENIKFQKEDFSEADAYLSGRDKKMMIYMLVKWLILAGIFGLFFWFVIRPFMRWVSSSFQESVDEVLPKTIEELEELQNVDNTLPGMSGALPMIEESLDPDKAEAELLRERILHHLDQDGKKGAFALAKWLDDRRSA